jgi:L-lactate dehydrogenase complex protein LldG
MNMADTSASKENILKKIRKALSNPVPLPFANSEGSQSVFKTSAQDDAVVFAEEFTKLQGRFSFCMNEAEMLQQLDLLLKERGWQKVVCVEPTLVTLLSKINVETYHNLADCDVSITGCEYLVARTGSMVLSSAQVSGRTTSVYAPVHICIAYNSQLLYDVKDALEFLKEKYKENFPSFVTFATGPSRTADIEKTLVTGVHGPKEVFCFLIEERNA